jgi:hypothetical protein
LEKKFKAFRYSQRPVHVSFPKHLAKESGVSIEFDFTVARLVTFHPYKIIMMYELKQLDDATGIHFSYGCYKLFISSRGFIAAGHNQ